MPSELILQLNSPLSVTYSTLILFQSFDHQNAVKCEFK